MSLAKRKENLASSVGYSNSIPQEEWKMLREAKALLSTKEMEEGNREESKKRTQLLKDHIYYNANIVIGGSLNAIKYAHEKGYYIVNNCMDVIFPFDENRDELYLELNIETDLELYKHLLYDLSLRSLNMFSDKVRKIDVDLEQGMLSVYTKDNSRVSVMFDNLYVSDFSNVSGLEVKEDPTEFYRVFDWFDVRSGTKHNHDLLETESALCSKIYFYKSDRIDGNHEYKDLVAESVLSEQQLQEVEYSNSIVRLKTMRIMKDSGILGRSKGLNRNSPIEIEFYKRDIVPILERKIHEFSSSRNNTTSRSAT